MYLFFFINDVYCSYFKFSLHCLLHAFHIISIVNIPPLSLGTLRNEELHWNADQPGLLYFYLLSEEALQP